MAKNIEDLNKKIKKLDFQFNEKGKFSYYCLFLLGKNSGLRISEAVNFNLNLKKKQNLYLIHGKRHKKRAVFVDPAVITELQKNTWKPHQTNRFSFAHFLQRVKKELDIPTAYSPALFRYLSSHKRNAFANSPKSSRSF